MLCGISCLMPIHPSIGLLEDAMVSLSCGHCYCYSCQFRPPLLKIQCRQCRERTGLVIETQLRLVVQCYKHMCHILACHMKDKSPPVSPKNDAASEVVAVPQKDAVVEVVAEVDSATAGIGTAGVKGTATEEPTDRVGSGAVGTQQTDGGAGAVTGGDGKESKPLTVPTSVDPIGEILKEVQKGEKVSRAVLMIKPPAKYVNVRVSTSRKDLYSHSQKSTTNTLPAATPSSGMASPPHHRGSGSAENDNSLGTTLDEIPMDSEMYSVGKSPSKSRKSTKQQQRTDVYQTSTSVQSPEIGIRTKHAYGSPDVSKEDVDASCADGKITKAGNLLQTADLEVMPGCLKEDHIVITSSTVEIKKLAPQLPDSRSPVTSKPTGFRVGFKRARSPLSPRLYDTKRRKIKYSARQHSDAVTSRTVDTKSPEKQHQSKEGSSVESPAELSKTISAGSTPVQSLGELTPPVKRRRRPPGGSPRCRCGTNHPQVLDKICARGKCPCFSKGIPCIRCLCRHCHNPINQAHESPLKSL